VDIDDLLRHQFGVISRRQVLETGGDDNLIARLIRRRVWRPLLPGVYVDHTGLPTQEQSRQGAVLYAWPAALAGESALAAHGVLNMPSRGTTVAIDHTRRVREQPGLQIVRQSQLDAQVLWNRHPPRVRLEAAALQVASERLVTRDVAAAVAVLADVCQQRLTTPARLLTALEGLRGLRGRAFLHAVLADVATGAYSALEHRYLTRVERAHGLPRGSRQRRFQAGARAGFRDVAYPQQRLIVELDGRLGHEWASDQWADLERDLHSATERLQTIRLGWGAVSTPCRLAPLLGRVLQSRGWSAAPHPCTHCGSG
jgi:hypothetical protein